MRNTKGISVAGDVLFNETADGVNLNDLWEEIGKALELDNEHRSTIVRLLSYPTIAVADIIPQSVEGESFEIATEMGIPTAVREPADYLRLGYKFQDYDKRLSVTWKWLRSATAEQVTAQVTRIFEADNRLVSGTILRRPLDPAPGSTSGNTRCTACGRLTAWCRPHNWARPSTTPTPTTSRAAQPASTPPTSRT